MAQTHRETFGQPWTAPAAPRRGAFGEGFGLSALLNLLMTWQQRASDRHHLRSMSDQMLSDIALRRTDIDREARKPFWQA